jgi:hypothetical protein
VDGGLKVLSGGGDFGGLWYLDIRRSKISMQQAKDIYEYSTEEFVRRLEHSVNSDLGMDLDTFIKRHSRPNGELLSFTEAHLVRAARLAGLLKTYS